VAFTDRGDVFAAKQDYERAFVNYNEAVKLDPTNARAVRHRGAAYAEKNDYKRAIADYNGAIRLNPENAYSVLFLYLARMRAGAHDSAAELETNAKNLRQDWPNPVVELFLGRWTPKAVLAAAPAAPGEHCEAEFYVGEWHLLRGDQPKAVEALKAAIETCPKALVEYDFAGAELQRLQP
jgi:lipoprotein NlpI